MSYQSNQIGTELTPGEELAVAQLANLGSPGQILTINALGTGIEYTNGGPLTNYLYKPGIAGGQIAYFGANSGNNGYLYSNPSKNGNIYLGDNLVFNEANSSLYLNGYAGIGTAPNSNYKLNVSANGSTVGTTFLASNLYSGAGQESYAGYGLAYNASSHPNPRATGLRFQGVDYNGSKISGTVTTNGGWLSARDDASRTYLAGASHSLRAGYFAVDSARGDWSANPSVVTCNFLGGLAPTGFGSNHTHYNIYATQGQNYLGGSITSASYISGKKSGVYAYLSAPDDTTITTASTYYPIEGTFTNGPVENFEGATSYPPGIKYQGTLTQYFEIDWHSTISADVNNTTVSFAIFKNGVLYSGSDMEQFCKNADEKYNLSGTAVVELAEGDEIQLVVTSDGDGDVITIYKYTTTINEFFD